MPAAPAVPLVLGADGVSRNRWVVAELADGAPLAWHLVTGAEALLALADARGAAAVAVDVPVGLPEDGRRRCDQQARAALGPRRSSLFMTAPRRVLDHADYGSARRALPGLTAQAFALLDRVRDVEMVLRGRGPRVHDRVVECHPEVTFRRMAGRDLPRKRSARGALARVDALAAQGLHGAERAPDEADFDDALDAMACAWTARRWVRGDPDLLLLGDGERDATGCPMRIVA